MTIKPKFFSVPEHFRKWLEENHHQETELWVGFYKKGSGKPSITWPESVDQALCFGWIDGLRKSIDEESYKIRFTPRKPNSIWSTINLKKIEELTKKGLIHPAGIEVFRKRDEKKTYRYSFERKSVKLDKAYEQKLKSNKAAWKFFQSLAPSWKNPSIWWVMSAKQKATRLRRLETLIKCSEEGRRIPPLVIGKDKKQ